MARMWNSQLINVKTADEGECGDSSEEAQQLSSLSISQGQTPEPEGSIENNEIELANNLRIVRAIPGANSGMCLDMWSLRRKGYRLFRDKMRRHRSTVFRMKSIDDRIVLCDWHSIQFLFDESRVMREKSFGSLAYNPVLLNKYTPSIFSTGPEHASKKKFVREFLKSINTPNLIKQIVAATVDEIQGWKDFEAEGKAILIEPYLDRISARLVTSILFGKPLSDLDVVESWLNKSLEFEYGIDLTDGDELKVAEKINNEVSASPVVEKITSLASQMQVDANSMLKEIIFVTLFNAYGGLKHAIASCLALLLKLPPEERTQLRAEAVEFLRTDCSWEDVHRLQKISSFVMEVLRLHPSAPFIFGRASQPFVLRSKTGYFQIQQGELLCASIYMAQRDPDLFPIPDDVDLNRYKDKSCTKYVLTFGGCFSEESVETNRKCPGQNLSLTLLSAVTTVLLNCDVVPSSSLEWTGKYIHRLSAPDKPLEVRKFIYRTLDQH